MNWRLDVRQAAFVQTDDHIDDLEVLHESFAEWLGSARLELAPGIRLTAFAASEEEASRFEAEATSLIREHDLFLITSLRWRDGEGSTWQKLESNETPVTDEAIEAELTSFIEDGQD